MIKKTVADDVLDKVKQAQQAQDGPPPQADPTGPEIELTPRRYKAYALMRKKGTGGLWVLRELEVFDGKIVTQTDTVENTAGVLIGDAMYRLEKEI